MQQNAAWSQKGLPHEHPYSFLVPPKANLCALVTRSWPRSNCVDLACTTALTSILLLANNFQREEAIKRAGSYLFGPGF